MPYRLRAILAVATILALALCGSAGAEIMVLGAPLDRGVWASRSCETSGCGFLDNFGRAPSPGVPPIWPDMPVNGVIVRLNVAGATSPGTMRVRTIGYLNTFEKLFETAGAPIAIVPSAGVQTYPMAMPIARGDQVGLSMSQGSSIGFLEGEGFFLSRWKSEPPESGPSRWDSEEPGLAGFNVEVQLRPSISTISTVPASPAAAARVAVAAESPAPVPVAAVPPPMPPSTRAAGPTSGGTKVIIAGYDLEAPTSVTFGAVPATSFTAVSEHEVDAIAPPSTTPISTPVSVTTVAGTATSSQKFEYVAPPVLCEVPKLKGRSLRGARRALRAARCGVGTITRRAGAKARSGKVVGQGSPPGSQFARGGKVDLTLAPPKPAHEKGGKGKR